jgi:peroxiredoxin
MAGFGSGNGRSPWLLFGGLMALGIAAVLLLFGSSLFGTGQNDTLSFAQIPAENGSVGNPNTAVNPPTVGDTAVNFTLTDLNNTPITLTQFQGQPIILNFWATWCAPCRIEMPELQAAYEAHQDDGLVILALDYDETPEQVRAFFDEMDLTFTPVIDENGAVARQYGVFNFPTTFFINRAGQVTAVHHGPMTQSQINNYLTNTLNNE